MKLLSAYISLIFYKFNSNAEFATTLEGMKSGKSLIAKLALTIICTLLATSCGLPTGNERPDDSKLRDGIKLLINQFESKYPQSINWDSAKVKIQISKRLPEGAATEAGWTLKWIDYSDGELSSVVIPWMILAQYPSKFAVEADNFTGGTNVPAGIAVQITKLQQDYFGSSYFAAVINQRISKVDGRWIIFKTVPYLPVTDNAYGFAESVNGKWKISDFGTGVVGCLTVPVRVLNEFGLTCPPK